MSDMHVRVTVDQDLFSMIAMIADRLDNINRIWSGSHSRWTSRRRRRIS